MYSHPYINSGTIQERKYQTNILKTALTRNTLVVLPTGTGKTNIAVLLAAHQLQQYSDKKILIMSPTRPLCSQHEKSFMKYLNVDNEDIVLVTGVLIPSKREAIYKYSKVVIATPQTIRNDIENNILDLKNFSLLVVDECHRSVGNYAYTYVAKKFKENSKGLILGLTASPGSSEEKIQIICSNLFINAVEIRTETDEDITPYIKEKEVEWIKVDLSPELLKIQLLLKNWLQVSFVKLKKYKIHIRSKKDLLEIQQRTIIKLKTEKNPSYFYLIMLLTQSIKVWHLLELVETQSVEASLLYVEKLKRGKIKSDINLIKDSKIQEVFELLEESGEHPKMEKLEEIMKFELKENPNLKFIIFSHYRDNIQKIFTKLGRICKPAILIGQAGEKGLTQKQQISIIRDYEDGYYNCLITSPIGEEGLDIKGGADIAIFYEPVASEIRTIQRRGRVGRTKVGKIIFLMAKNTRDQTNYYIAQRKESKMKEILKNMQSRTSIGDFV